MNLPIQLPPPRKPLGVPEDLAKIIATGQPAPAAPAMPAKGARIIVCKCLRCDFIQYLDTPRAWTCPKCRGGAYTGSPA